MRNHKVIWLTSILLVSLFLSSCTFISSRQQEHINNQLDILQVENKRAKRFLEMVREGTLVADPAILRFIDQRSSVISNVDKSIRLIIGGSGESEE